MADQVIKEKQQQSNIVSYFKNTPKHSGKRDQPSSSPDNSSPSMQQVEKLARLVNLDTSLSDSSLPNSDSTENIISSVEKETVFKLSDVVCATLKNQEFMDSIIPLITEKVIEMVKPKIVQIVDECMQPHLLSIKHNKDALILNTIELNKYKEEMKMLKTKLGKVEARIEEQEQYSRRTSLRFHNVPVPTDDNGDIIKPINTDALVLDICNKNLKLNLNTRDIGRSHPIGEIKDGKIAIIVRFLSYRQRQLVFNSKRYLKGNKSKIFIAENLTKHRTCSNLIAFYLLLLCLLLICGDIEPNPGPERTHEYSEKTLSIFHCNIRSLRNKLNYIADIIEDYDVVFFTETHLDSNITDYDISIMGFEAPVRKDRNSHGGGIIMYFKNYVHIIRRQDLEHDEIENDANTNLPEFDDRCHDFLSQIIVSEQDVLDIVSTLDANKAVGPDIVSNRMLLATTTIANCLQLDNDQEIVLMLACLRGRVNIVKLLLENRVSYKVSRNECDENSHESDRNILDKKAFNESDIDMQDNDGNTALHIACKMKHKNIVHLLLQKWTCTFSKYNNAGQEFELCSSFGNRRKNVKIVVIILKAACNVGCDINQTNSNKKTPLMVAVSNEATHIVKLLIDNGCDLNKCNSNEIKAFHMACRSNYNGNIIELFLKRKMDFNLDTWDRLGRTGLHYAVFGKNLKAIKLLRKTEMNINKQDEHKNTAIHNAYQCFQIEIVNELLRNAECDINLSDETGKSILHIACERNDISMLRTLLRKDCAINAQDGHARTPMHIAMSANYTDIFTLLVNKSDLNAKYMNGWTPLHIACREQRVSAVNILLQAACDVNIQDNTGKTPLHIAAGEKDTSIVENY
ncbi:unnamed protein product [Mytilus edulis]|uniref:Uncharacterized protein n=1 Tax=Mytilus edulis TaxID=6550 RepID=A0A8S3UH29_MYTED|nr:unnamed protein product [Mytilus edulis]